MQEITGEHPCRSGISIKLQLYLNHTSARVFSYKFAAYSQNTFPYKRLWRAISGTFKALLINVPNDV